MTVEFAVITGVVSIILGFLGFFSGRISEAKKDAHKEAVTLTAIQKDLETLRTDLGKDIGSLWSELAKDIGYIQKDVTGIREDMERNETNHAASIRRLHDRIDEHERFYHSANPNQSGKQG